MVYYKITNADGKQWVMPSRNMRIGMMLYQPSAWTGKMLKALLPWLSWSSLVRKKLHIEQVSSPIADSLDCRLKEIFGKNELEYAAFNGTPCAHQKQTIQIYAGSRILGYCKISESEEIASLFRGEQDYLQWLSACGVAGVPRCMACERIDLGAWIFVQSTTKSMRSTIDHAFGSRQMTFLEHLYQKTVTRCDFGETDMFQSLRRVDGCIESFDKDDQQIVRSAYELVSHYYKTCCNTFAAYHCDFTPWNMFVERGELFVFDWEYAKRTFMPYLDIIHFLFQTCVFERHADAEGIYSYLMVENAELLNRYFDEPKVAVAAYLLDMLGMYAVRDAGHETVDTRRLKALRLQVLGRVLRDRY